MTTLKDIADHCDLSVSLVSKVLNNRMGTSSAKPEVVQTIHRVAQELGYRKNQSAAALRSGRHDVIGVFMHHFGRPGTGLAESMLQGISNTCGQNHQRQTLTFYREAAEFRAAAWAYHAGTMDGVIVSGLPHGELFEDLKQMHQGGFPMVTIHPDPVLGDDVPNVGISEASLTRMATEHLLAKGCRNLVQLETMNTRTPGFVQAMRDAGQVVTDAQIIQCGFSHDAGQKVIAQLIDRNIAFDGIVAQCDEHASGALAALLARGVRVPQDVRIIGIDNSPYCQYLPVQLSSICQQPFERGQMAVTLLNDLIAGKTSITSQNFKPLLYARASTA
jgi:LacI family transcriptional regulator